MGNIALLLQESGEIAQARAMYGPALAILREVGNRSFEGLALVNLARLERQAAGDDSAAAACLTKARALLQDQPDIALLASCACEEGHLALARGAHPLKSLREARDLAERAGIGRGSGIGREVDQLARAAAAAAEGRTLYRGDLIEDIPDGIRRWLAGRGELPGGAG